MGLIGIPKIAIECDGAKYHSSQEAYLYDRHRQKILEEHGFVFHRIWSTNWWRNTSRETTKLIDFIKNVETSNKKEFVDYSNTAFAFLLALVLIFLVLAAQFESFVDPLIIMITVPLALSGALIALWATGQTINIFSQIGMIMLIGLVTKNGILIV